MVRVIGKADNLYQATESIRTRISICKDDNIQSQAVTLYDAPNVVALVSYSENRGDDHSYILALDRSSPFSVTGLRVVISGGHSSNPARNHNIGVDSLNKLRRRIGIQPSGY